MARKRKQRRRRKSNLPALPPHPKMTDQKRIEMLFHALDFAENEIKKARAHFLAIVAKIPKTDAAVHDFAPPPDGAAQHDDPPSRPAE